MHVFAPSCINNKCFHQKILNNLSPRMRKIHLNITRQSLKMINYRIKTEKHFYDEDITYYADVKNNRKNENSTEINYPKNIKKLSKLYD
ncbi:hypothetical protein HZS_4932 [Henneguya salminicola]|nr:hypothetical protein HZS_4932 [Henneguya salminicola]